MAPSGSKKPPYRAPTIIDVAQRANVSKSTVSNVLQGKIPVADKTRDQVLAAIEELGYRTNAGARHMRQRSQVLGIVVGDLRNPFHAELAALIEEHAAARQHSILLATTGGIADREAARVQSLIEYRVAAIMFLAFVGGRSTLKTIPEDVIRVFVSLVGPGASIAVDDHEGARLAVDHLLDLGHKRIAYVGSARGDEPKTETPRFIGFSRVLESRGVALDERLVVRRPQRIDEEEISTADRLRVLLTRKPRPTAVFAASDFTALEVMEAADALDLEIPGDLSIVGFDDIDVSDLSRIRLTTIAQPKSDLAERAVHLAIGAPSGDGRARRGARLAPTLIVRNSTGPPTKR